MAGRALWLDSAREVSWCLVALSCRAARERLVSSGLSIIAYSTRVTLGGSEVIIDQHKEYKGIHGYGIQQPTANWPVAWGQTNRTHLL